MAGKDYYGILGIRRDATEQEIKQAYRRLARKYHPDVNPGDKSAEDRFKLMNEAYEVLSDAEKRRKYDQFGDQWQYADQFAKAGAQHEQSAYWDFTRGRQYADQDLDGVFEEFFQGMGRRGRRSRRGQDIEYSVEVTLEEAYQGAMRALNLEFTEPCPTCRGTGRIQNAICAQCRGAGAVPRVKRLEVKIPTGVKDGSRVRFAGQGAPGEGGSGDLYLLVSVKPHPLFERHDDDLYTEVAVPLTVAVLGGEVEVPTPKGKLMLKIPPETQNGRTFRLSGQGMPHLNNSARGDLVAKVKVVLPTNLSAQEKELFQQLGRLRGGG